MKTRLMVTIVAAVMCLSGLAAAQQTQRIIDFSGLPLTGAPLPIPSGYAGMNWNDLWYTTLRFTEGIRNVALPAFGSHAQSMTAANPSQPFQLLGLAVKGDYGSTLTVYAYTNGGFTGSQSYSLAPLFTPVRIPLEWGPVTQVTFICRDAQQRPANFNLYSLTLQ
jgi:hypothetical protein